jgi:hypothetical protein
MLDFICEHMGEKQGDILLAALTLFYRNCFSNERRMLHDMGFFLDNLALQNQELCMETSALEDLAQMAIELESSPYFSPDEEDEEDEEVPDVDFSDGTSYKTPPPPPKASKP